MTGNQEKQPKINLAVKAAEDDLLGTGRTILAEAGRWPCLAGYGNRGWLQVPQHVFIYKPVRNDGR